MSLQKLKETLQRKKIPPSNRSQRPLNRWLALYFTIAIAFFVARAVIFAGNYGGIEFDSGWIFGVAKNLAHRGIYASYSNLSLEEGVGTHPSIYQSLTVQDENGFCYFPASVFSIGPGYVIPEAILLKLFGDGWWQYRSWPLLSYICFLFLVFYIVWRIGGIWALVIMQVWLWIIPQLTVNLAFESYSEQTALVYLMGSFLLFCRASTSRKRALYMLLSGCLVSAAVLTKLLLIFTLPAFMAAAVWELLKRHSGVKSITFRWVAFSTGFTLPIAIFESYRFISLVTQFGLEGWRAINEDFRQRIIYHGSGISTLDRFDLSFIYGKLNVWSHVGVEPFWVPWVCFLIIPLILIRRSQEQDSRLIALIYGSAIVLMSWFILISPTGWGHHAWFGLLLSMILISIGIGDTLGRKMNNLNKRNVFILLWVFALMGLVARFDKMEIKPLLDQQTISKWIITREQALGFPHVPVFSLADQKETIDFFAKSIRREDRVYYLGWYLVAEMSSLVDKVFYPFGRHFNNGQKNPDGGRSYLILGPYQQGPLRQVPEWYNPAAIGNLCARVVFANKSYTVCTLKEDLNL